MSEIGLNINVDSYNNEGIKTIKGNNNAEIYKLYILKNKRRLSLVGKTVKLGYVMAGTTNGDVIENLNITNAEQGEITFPITNSISKRDGVYSCQLAIYGADGFLEHTATFGLTVEANIFNKIAGEIENSKDLTYIERILEEAKTVSGDLKTNIPVADNLNRSLEDNINKASNINNTLADTTERSKVAAIDAIEKTSDLESSIVEAKKFIDGLDGSQNIPQIRLDVTELQNGLKSNQALAYNGSSISAENTLEGRTENMMIKGKTLFNIHSKTNYSFSTSIPQENYTLSEGQNFCEVTIKKYPSSSYYYINAGTINFDLLKPNQKYTLLAKATDGLYPSIMTGGYEFPLTAGGTSFKNGVATMTTNNLVNGSKGQLLYINLNGGATYKQELRDIMIFEGDLSIIPGSYFEDIKSFGEAEKVEDKYKISILSNNENYFKLTNDNIFGIGTAITVNGNSFTTTTTNGWNQGFGIQVDRIPSGKYKTVFEVIENKDKGVLYEIEYFKDNNSIKTMPLNSVQYEGIINVENIDYDYFKLKFKNGREQYPIGYKYLMLVPYDSNINTYVEKKSDKKDILIKEPLRENDIMYEDNGQVKVNRYARQYTFTGNESIRTFGLTDETTELGFEFLDFKLGFKPVDNNFPNAISNRFKVYSTVYSGSSYEGIALNQNGNTYIRISKDKLSTPDVNGIKAWLKANPTTIVYQLSEPVVEIVENCVDIDLDTYQERTYFNILNSLPGTLEFKVSSNIGSLLQNLAKEVNNIWDVINNLLVPSLIETNKNIAMATIKNNLK